MINSARSRFGKYILLLTLIISACIPATPDMPTPNPVTPDGEPTTGWVYIYFTNPYAPHADDYEGGPDENLAAAIDQARLSVDIAAYNINLWSIRDALIHAYKRGVVVRMVMESDNMDTQAVKQILETGIPIISDQREGLMHNKFVVIDRSEVWSGSMNYTTNGAYKDNNNLICMRSTQVAEDYTSEFNEMFKDNRFGQDEGLETPHPRLIIDGTPVEIYFSPDDGVAAQLLELIQEAEESIQFMAYTFTDYDLGDAIIQRAAEGLTVTGVMDDDQIDSNQGTEYETFLQAGLTVRRDGNSGQMHHKVIIIDEKIVITGSYNFSTSAAEKNDENVVIIFSPEVASRYLEEFRRVFNQAQPALPPD